MRCEQSTNICVGAGSSGDVDAAVDGGGDFNDDGGGGNGGATAWLPDFRGQLVRVKHGDSATPTSVTLDLSALACSPNSVAVHADRLYVACEAGKILVFSAANVTGAADGATVSDLMPVQMIISAEFNSLIGIAFDAGGNLWIASFGNSEILTVSAASLATATPVASVSLVNTPGSPVAMAFDSDGSMWVTGQFSGGILLNVPASEFGKGANATPRFCISNNASNCQQQAGRFNGIEGVALFDGHVWVSNEGTNMPGRELVQLHVSGTALVVDKVFGDRAQTTGPFLCPGGLFGTDSHLWVNDQGFGRANTTCGVTDQASGVGGILRFTAAQLAAETSDPAQVLRFANATGRPGFGGLFVQND